MASGGHARCKDTRCPKNPERAGGWGVRGEGWPQPARAVWDGALRPGEDRQGLKERGGAEPRPRPQESERAAGPRAAPGSREQEAPGAAGCGAGPAAQVRRGAAIDPRGDPPPRLHLRGRAALHLPPRATGGDAVGRGRRAGVGRTQPLRPAPPPPAFVLVWARAGNKGSGAAAPLPARRLRGAGIQAGPELSPRPCPPAAAVITAGARPGRAGGDPRCGDGGVPAGSTCAGTAPGRSRAASRLEAPLSTGAFGLLVEQLIPSCESPCHHGRRDLLYL